jgi:hypothetical protein
MPDAPSPYSGLFPMLVAENLISPFDSARIQKQIRDRWTPIGTILVRQGHLTMSDLAVLLEMQADEPQVRLGDLAVREGYCSEKEIAQAVREQKSAGQSPPELLAAELAGREDRALKILLRYAGQLEARLREQPVLV